MSEKKLELKDVPKLEYGEDSELLTNYRNAMEVYFKDGSVDNLKKVLSAENKIQAMLGMLPIVPTSEAVRLRHDRDYFNQYGIICNQLKTLFITESLKNGYLIEDENGVYFANLEEKKEEPKNNKTRK